MNQICAISMSNGTVTKDKVEEVYDSWLYFITQDNLTYI